MAEKEQDKATDTTPAPETGQPAAVPSPKTEQKPVELAPEIQAEVDRRITKALQTARDNWQTQESAKLEEVKSAEEQKRLEEQGKYKELAEQRQSELDALRAEKERADFLENARGALKDAGVSEFSDILLTSDLSTIDGVRKVAEELKAMLHEKTQTEINERIDTGKRPNGAPAGPLPEKPSDIDMTQPGWQEQWEDLQARKAAAASPLAAPPVSQ